MWVKFHLVLGGERFQTITRAIGTKKNSIQYEIMVLQNFKMELKPWNVKKSKKHSNLINVHYQKASFLLLKVIIKFTK